VPSSALTVDEGHVLFGVNVGNQAGRAVSLDASSGHLEWTQLLRSPVFAVNSGASANSTFFVVDLSGGMFAFNLANGAQQWDFQFNPARRTQFGYEDFIGPPVVAGGFVVVGLADGRLAAVDSTTGHLAWTTNTGDGALQAIAMSSEGSVVVTKSGSNGGVIGFKEGSGSLTDVLSPTTMQLGTVLTNYALAFLVLVALGLLAGYLLRKRGASKRTTGRDDQRDDLVVIEDAPQAIPESDDPTHGDPGETEGED
jgi:outer membrane protein assembly factor BamB